MVNKTVWEWLNLKSLWNSLIFLEEEHNRLFAGIIRLWAVQLDAGQFTLYTVHSTFYIVQYKLYTVSWTQYTLYRPADCTVGHGVRPPSRHYVEDTGTQLAADPVFKDGVRGWLWLWTKSLGDQVPLDKEDVAMSMFHDCWVNTDLDNTLF